MSRIELPPRAGPPFPIDKPWTPDEGKRVLGAVHETLDDLRAEAGINRPPRRAVVDAGTALIGTAAALLIGIAAGILVGWLL